MTPLAWWNWLRRNFSFVLLLAAVACLAFALGEVIRGITWSLLIPVALLSSGSGWGLAKSRLNPIQAWASLTALGLPAVFIYVTGLILPIGRLMISILSLIPQAVLWLQERVRIDTGILISTWIDVTHHLASVLSRFWTWWIALYTGTHLVDPLIVGLVWCLLLWLIGGWAGWQLRRNRQALIAFVPSGVVLAITLDYTRGEISFVVVYLAILLILMGLTKNESRHIQWQQRKIDYSESIKIDTLIMVGLLTIFLTLLAAGAPSISWYEFMGKLRSSNQTGEEQIAESLGLKTPVNVAVSAIYRSDGLPRSHLLDMPPELSQEIVITVSTGELPPIPETVMGIQPNRYYWRAITYDVYSGAGWSSSPAQDVLLSSNTPLLTLPQTYRPLIQHVKRNLEQNGKVYWTGILAQADVDIKIAWRTKSPNNPNPTHNGDMLGALTESNKFTVISYIPQFNVSELRAAGSDYPTEIIKRYLQLPDSTPERVLSLAQKLTQAAPTPYDRAAAIETYLRTFPYTLEIEPPPPGRDVVDYFLFTTQKGYCDYYATAMVVLARAVGLPARIVVGYASGDYYAPSAEYLVRQEDAHSWVEIYFSGIGWVEFEPTASQPAIERSGDEGASTQPPSLPGGLSVTSWLKLQWITLISSLRGQLVLTGIGIFLLILFWKVIEIGVLYLFTPQKAVALIYSRMEKGSMRLLPNLQIGYTPYQLQLALIDRFRIEKRSFLRNALLRVETDIEHITNLFIAQVFSQHPPTKKQVNTGIRSWIRVRWRLWIAAIWKID